MQHPKDSIRRFQGYLAEALGEAGTLHPEQSELLRQLPHHIRNQFELDIWALGDQRCVLMVTPNLEALRPTALTKQAHLIADRTGLLPILILEGITAYERRRLIEEKVSFVVPASQMYLPHLNIDLRETFRARRKQNDKLRPAAQLLLFYHLTVQRLDGRNLTEIANALELTPMSTMRAVDELENIGLCESNLSGRARIVKFVQDAKTLWRNCKPVIKPPFRKTVYVNNLVDPNACRTAGLSALAEYTMLTPPSLPQVAIDRSLFRKWRNYNNFHAVQPRELAAFELQLWAYPPTLLSRTNLVDELSLLASIDAHGDERVEAALEELENEVLRQWW